MQKNMISLWPLRIQGKQVSKPEIKYLRQHWSLKRLGRQLSMRILGAKFKFSVGHGKFNFPPLYAEIASSGWTPIVSLAIEAIIAVDLKKYHASIIVWRNFVYFSTVTRKNGSKKDRSARTCRPTDAFSWVCLISSSSLGRLELSCWVAGLGIATNFCNKTTCFYKRAIVELIEKYERYLLKHAQMLPVYAYVVKLQDSDRDSSFIRSLEAPIIIEKDWSYLLLTRLRTSCTLACRRTQPACAFPKDSLECFVSLVFASNCFYPCR